MTVPIFLIVSASAACFNEAARASPVLPDRLVGRVESRFPQVEVSMVANVALEDHDFDVNGIGVKWVVTDLYGLLLEASREAADMLNLSVAGLRRRQLLVFFDGEREDWRQALRAAAAGMMVDREGAVRPRDRRPLFIRAEITKTQDWRHGDALLWTFSEPESCEAVAS